jgi:hypothetical protein
MASTFASMPKRSRTEDASESAYRTVQTIIERHDPDAAAEPRPQKKLKAKRKNPAAVALGRKGGLKGGKARAAKLTAEQRSASARLAAKARWEKPQD